MAMDDVFRDIDARRDEYVALLQKLCRQPSISAQKIGIREMAALLAATMRELGIDTKICETTGDPIVFGEVKGASDRTLLFYNHYDVQPPEPLEKWDSPPFAAEIRDGKIYARGATDNKGNVMTRLAAVRSLLNARGKLPITVKFLFDGEEEIGSHSLLPFIQSNMGLLKADACVWEDCGSKDHPDQPMISLGNKGMTYLQLNVRTAQVDFHSSLAPIYENAIWRLVWALASLKGPDGRVAVEGFYDDVVPLTEEEKALADAMGPVSLAERKRLFGIRRFVNDMPDKEVNRHLVEEPTCNVAGIYGGYTGQGDKTIVPCEAFAKLDLRLVVAQRPEDIAGKVQKHLRKHGFDEIEVEVLSRSEPSTSPIHSHLNDAIAEAALAVYGKRPVIKPRGTGGTPAWMVNNYMKIPVTGTGIGYAGARTHGHNENIDLRQYHDGIKFMAATIASF